MMEAFIRGDEAATTEVRDEFRAALTAFKESHGTEVLAEARKRRKSAQGASSPTTTTGRQ
jgi:hypothetical protein